MIGLTSLEAALHEECRRLVIEIVEIWKDVMQIGVGRHLEAHMDFHSFRVKRAPVTPAVLFLGALALLSFQPATP
jgi:hypothetical protein